MPLVPTVVVELDVDDPRSAIDALNAMAEKMRAASPGMTPAQVFAAVYQDPANAKLALRERAEARASCRQSAVACRACEFHLRYCWPFAHGVHRL
jgi:hypothetical protein